MKLGRHSSWVLNSLLTLASLFCMSVLAPAAASSDQSAHWLTTYTCCASAACASAATSAAAPSCQPSHGFRPANWAQNSSTAAAHLLSAQQMQLCNLPGCVPCCQLPPPPSAAIRPAAVHQTACSKVSAHSSRGRERLLQSRLQQERTSC